MKRANDLKFDFMNSENSILLKMASDTSASLSTFFRYYLTIMSVPAVFLPYFLSIEKTSDAYDKNICIIPSILILIGIIGVIMMRYLISLKCKEIAYTRSIASIRKYFIDNLGIDADFAGKYIYLPFERTSIKFYSFKHPIQICSLISSFYLASSMFIIFNKSVHAFFWSYVLCFIVIYKSCASIHKKYEADYTRNVGNSVKCLHGKTIRR